jgi:hypothetical protein
VTTIRLFEVVSDTLRTQNLNPRKEIFINIKDNSNDEVIDFDSKYLTRERKLFILLETRL